MTVVSACDRSERVAMDEWKQKFIERWLGGSSMRGVGGLEGTCDQACVDGKREDGVSPSRSFPPQANINDTDADKMAQIRKQIW